MKVKKNAKKCFKIYVLKANINIRSKSLGVYTGRYKTAYAIRISQKNFGFDNGIKSVPLYATFCVR